jgi:serine/threonine-protein kinase
MRRILWAFIVLALFTLLPPMVWIQECHAQDTAYQRIPAIPGSRFGAIAYSTSTANWGTSYDHASEAAARNAALDSCGQSDCKVVVWFQNACGALAVGSTGSGAAWGQTRSEAEEKALLHCPDKDGRIICWACCGS